MTLSPADTLYSAARVALFCALVAPVRWRQAIVALSAELEAEALLRGARPARTSMYRIAVV